MSSAATVALAVLPAAVAVGGTLGATWMQNRNATDARVIAARAKRRTDAGQVLGRLRILLVDMSPEIVALNIDGAGDAAMPELVQRWRDLRDELAVFAESDPDPVVAATARDLTVEVANALNRLGGVLYEQKAHMGMGRDMFDAAREHHARAGELIDRLSAIVRGQG